MTSTQDCTARKSSQLRHWAEVLLMSSTCCVLVTTQLIHFIRKSHPMFAHCHVSYGPGNRPPTDTFSYASKQWQRQLSKTVCYFLLCVLFDHCPCLLFVGLIMVLLDIPVIVAGYIRHWWDTAIAYRCRIAGSFMTGGPLGAMRTLAAPVPWHRFGVAEFTRQNLLVIRWILILPVV